MRLLLDDYNLGWEAAWEITLNTSHTPITSFVTGSAREVAASDFGKLPPRHLQIIL